MATPLSLPRIAWGDPSSHRTALLVHGLGSNGALMWRFGTALADAGWYAVAVDLRGHGLAPRATDYTLAAYAADVAEVRPEGSDSWGLVIGHSLGGAAVTIAAAANPAWARQLVLIDPAIALDDNDHSIVRESQEQSYRDPSLATIEAEHPEWHPLDWEGKAAAVAQSSRWATQQTMDQNDPWDARVSAARLATPTHVIGADPAVFSLFTGHIAADVLENPLVSLSVVTGAGHSPHRDDPEQTLVHLFDAIAD